MKSRAGFIFTHRAERSCTGAIRVRHGDSLINLTQYFLPMKIPTLIFTLYLLCSWFVHADTYVWEDYDDFSGSSLDPTKWEVGYFAGGESVTIINGQAKLSGSNYSINAATQMPNEVSDAATDSTEGNTFLFITDSTISGMEADIMIPNASNQDEVGIYLATLDISPLGSLGFELRKTATGNSFNYDYFNDQGSKVLGYQAGSLDIFQKIKITKLNGETSYYLDNTLIKVFEYIS